MNKEKLVEQALHIHMERAREIGLLAEGFIGRSEIRILLWLSRKKEACAVDIMEFFGLSAGRVSNLLKALENKGYIRRERIPDDHRRVRITLTKSGKQCAQGLDQNLHKVFITFFEVLGKEDAEKFLAFEQKVLDLIRNGELEITPPGKI